MSELTINLPLTINRSPKDIYQNQNVKIPLPERCPLCDQVQSPIFLNSSGLEEGLYSFSVILECNNCKQHFLQSYKLNGSSSSRMGVTIKNADKITFEYQLNEDEFSDEIASCSSEFINIYKQIKIAEKHNLSELLKLGYRKATEQLVWDYLIKFEGKAENNLQKKSFPDRIKLLKLPESDWLSDLIAWVGNDGAHPYQRHENLTNQDMKKLSNILISNVQTLIQQHNYKSYHSDNK
ncbi:hypothetical protein [Staphylococcus cohnii]|uniref:hypothetical protein n=1 Tax=Staphylococcus cohnii TaxID=29382 RepID=UPI002551C32A|nr:hypothetical protein [Staphylococcus cohnii]WIL68777.1 hypothetical protein QMK35_08540 [Staphylococcus cohnii]